MDRAMKTEELDTLLGKVVSFEENDTPYYQDRGISKGIPVGVQFTIEKKSNNNDYWLVADGYGNLTKPNAYGKGRICVGEKDVIRALDVSWVIVWNWSRTPKRFLDGHAV